MGLADLILAYAPLPSVPSYLTTWQPGRTPLSTTPVVLAVLVGYLTTIFSVQHALRDRPAYVLNTLFRAHNIILSVGSAILLALMVEELAPIIAKNGLWFAMCDPEAWTPRLEFYYIVNYYFKYVELIDTIFLALKKKPLAFLHVFHHSATALLCWNQLNGRTSISWTVIVLNLFVHVIMYYYYYGTAGGRRFWWKQHVTTMQIAQFVIDLGIVYYASAQLFLYRHRPAFPQLLQPYLPITSDCAGQEHSAVFGCALLTSYLFLFIEFFIRTYGNKTKKGGSKPLAQKKVVEGKIVNGTNGHAKDL